jgi:hypothetical protein
MRQKLQFSEKLLHLHADEAGSEAEVGAAAAGDRWDPGGRADRTGKATAHRQADPPLKSARSAPKLLRQPESLLYL